MTVSYWCAFLLSTLGGHILIGSLVFLMRKTIIPNKEPLLPWKQQQFYHLWVGCTERLITTAIVIWAPAQIGLFVGGWSALKLAAAWDRRSDDAHTLAHIIALVGTAMSFSVAILAGLWVHPESLTTINSTE